MADGVTLPAQGTGDTQPKVATDDAGAAGQVQIVKLGVSTAGSAAKLPADAVFGLGVDVKRFADGIDVNAGTTTDVAVVTDAAGTLSGKLRGLVKMWADVWDSVNHRLNVAIAAALPAGTNNIGLVQPAPLQKRIQVTPTLDTSIYASGDNLAYVTTNGVSMAIANAARVSGGSGVIQSIIVLDKSAAQRAAMDILFFDRSVSAGNNVNGIIQVSDADMAFCLGVVTIGPYNTNWPATVQNSISTLLNVGLPFVLNASDLHFLVCVRGTPTYGASDLTFSFGILQD